MKESSNNAQVRLNRVSPSCWRVVLNNPPLNLMGPEFVLQFREIMTAIENDEQLRVVIFESAVDGFFLNHSDFNARLEDLTDGTSQGTLKIVWDLICRKSIAKRSRGVSARRAVVFRLRNDGRPGHQEASDGHVAAVRVA